MKKDLDAFLTEILESNTLKNDLAEALKNGRLDAFLKKNDCDADPETLMKLLRDAAKESQDESMSLNDMDAIAGGVSPGLINKLSVLLSLLD